MQGLEIDQAVLTLAHKGGLPALGPIEAPVGPGTLGHREPVEAHQQVIRIVGVDRQAIGVQARQTIVLGDPAHPSVGALEDPDPHDGPVDHLWVGGVDGQVVPIAARVFENDHLLGGGQSRRVGSPGPDRSQSGQRDNHTQEEAAEPAKLSTRLGDSASDRMHDNPP